jgi:hypothetical protein
MVRAWVNIEATRCITRACHPPSMKHSPRVLDSTYSDTLQMTRRQEDARCGSVKSSELG